MAPLVSIGLPVFNGERFLDEVVESILGQTFAELELIISDNGSTDNSRSIAESWGAKDPRVRIYCSEVNLGAAPNFNKTVALSQGKYFKWAACDDLLDKHFIARCVEILETRKDVILAYTDALDIDENGKELGLIYDSQAVIRNNSDDPVVRFGDLVCKNHSCIAVFGLIRIEELLKTKLIRPFVSSDRVLLAELGLRGRFKKIPEPLLLHREHPGRSTREVPIWRRAAWFDTSLEGKKIFPTWRLFGEFAKVILREKMGWRKKLACFARLVRWVYWGNWRLLIEDITYRLPIPVKTDSSDP